MYEKHLEYDSTVYPKFFHFRYSETWHDNVCHIMMPNAQESIAVRVDGTHAWHRRNKCWTEVQIELFNGGDQVAPMKAINHQMNLATKGKSQ